MRVPCSVSKIAMPTQRSPQGSTCHCGRSTSAAWRRPFSCSICPPQTGQGVSLARSDHVMGTVSSVILVGLDGHPWSVASPSTQDRAPVIPSDHCLVRRDSSRAHVGRGIPQGAPHARRAQPADCVGAPPTGQCLDLFLVGQGQKGSTRAAPQAQMADCALGVHGSRRYRSPVAARVRNGCRLVASMRGLLAHSSARAIVMANGHESAAANGTPLRPRHSRGFL